MGLIKYTPELIEKIKKQYAEGVDVQAIADGIDAPVRSVIAKLSAEGVYVRKSYVTKQGGKPIKKEQYIENIAKMLDIDICLLDSLEKVTKTALSLIEKRLVQKETSLNQN